MTSRFANRSSRSRRGAVLIYVIVFSLVIVTGVVGVVAWESVLNQAQQVNELDMQGQLAFGAARNLAEDALEESTQNSSDFGTALTSRIASLNVNEWGNFTGSGWTETNYVNAPGNSYLPTGNTTLDAYERPNATATGAQVNTAQKAFYKYALDSNAAQNLAAFGNPRYPYWGSANLRVVRYDFNVTANTTFGTTPISRTRTFHGYYCEVPALEFQFITAQTPFLADGSGSVIVQGRALFNAGIVRGNTTSTPTVTTAFSCAPSVCVGEIPVNTTNLNLPSFNYPRGFSWGLSDIGNLGASSGTGNVPQQSYAMISNVQNVDWPSSSSNITTSPMMSDPSISYNTTWNGGSHVIIDLSAYPGDGVTFKRVLNINCGDATSQDAGIVLKGCPNGSGAIAYPLIIVTNGRVTIVGSNYRPVILVSTSTNSPTLYTDFTNPAADVESDMFWEGYLCFPVTNLTFTTPQAWVSYGLWIRGTLLFAGGTINIGSMNRILIQREPALMDLRDSALVPYLLRNDYLGGGDTSMVCDRLGFAWIQ
jgi:hypothetical protein